MRTSDASETTIPEEELVLQQRAWKVFLENTCPECHCPNDWHASNCQTGRKMLERQERP